MKFEVCTRGLCGAAFIATVLVGTAARADVVISTDPTQNMSCTGGTCSPTYKDAVLNIGDLTKLLATADATVSSRILGKHKAKYAGVIRLRTPLSWTNGSKLTLDYYSSIEAPVSVLGSGGLIITGSATFTNSIRVDFANLGSTFSIGGTAYTLVGNFPTLANAITANPRGYYALANDYDATNDHFSKAPIAAFGGTLLGLGHSISNLTIPKGHKLCEGMIGTNTGSIAHFILNNVSVELDARSRYAGGIVGCNQGNLYDISVSGTVTGVSNGDAGGIVGINSTGVQFARSIANVTGGQAGGIAGQSDAGINNAWSAGTISGQIDTGGVAGLSNSYISESYSTATVSGSENNTGGLVGSNHGNISYCYAMGDVNGASGTSGGFVGFNGGTIQSAYSTGTVAGGPGHTGGFAGDDLNETIATAYWDVDASGISDPAQGAGDPQYDPGITGLITSQMKTRLPFGFGSKHWHEDPNINNGYPYLKNNPPPQ
ncbi:MAG TPA: GLUG motif-containing protein [Rhizomicrobium sp.]|jgi:hypothetical protein|nr:GLUG motif-containing protein [Rhizomicrobium sp.]